VVAAGIRPFAQRPIQFSELPPSLATHSVEHSDLGKFAGQQVIVVGGGQSAFESAALLSECGAEVELIMREAQVRWLHRSGLLHQEPISRLLYAPSDVGPAGMSWLVAMPDAFRRLPRDMQNRIAYRCIRPAASDWLRPRVGNVRITAGRNVIAARPKGNRAELDLDDGTGRAADHVLLATGYSIDVTHYPFLAPRLLQRLHRAGGYPILSDGFESSIPGLHFIGASSAWSFGPVMRFVAGTPYSAPALTRRIRASMS
jgi:cation diffusion facilitator CzcD-associated flavoprotein CzcO